MSLPRKLSLPSTIAPLLLGFAAIAACASPDDSESEDSDKATSAATATTPVPNVVAARSLAITAASVLEPCLSDTGLTACGGTVVSGTLESTFSLRRTLTRVLATAGVASAGAAPNDLARRLWDTHNVRASGAFSDVPHCDDTKDASGKPVQNGFPLQCPRNEGVMARSSVDMLSPASADYFYPIGLFNRLDLRDAANATCGEYRILYGRKDADRFAPTGRALLIFEAALPNPRPELGAAGCQPIAAMWANLSGPGATSAQARATLASFYYDGIDVTYPDGKTVRTMPVIHFDNLGAKRGQVRLNELMGGSEDARWQLRELHTGKSGATVLFAPEYVKTNPWPGLFSRATGADAFSQWFIAQVPSLSAAKLEDIRMADAREFGAGQSDSQTGLFKIVGPAGAEDKFSNDYGRFASGALGLAVQGRLRQAGSSLTPRNIFDRATTTSCGGCHQHSNDVALGGGLTWPASATFVHVNETPSAAVATDAFGGAGSSFAVSPALRDLFLPARAKNLTCVAGGGC